jgi:bis(5'-nucleosyl)-tetraphosphatase (symmetrical)
MAIYFLGDVQGCYRELTALLAKVEFDPTQDELWLVGDIVARGPHSLETVRLIKSMGNSAKMVLGNHDLHLLATHAGLKTAKQKDQLSALLNADDIDELMDWLAQQPVLRKLPNAEVYMSHAGLSPQWTIATAVKQAKKIQKKISGRHRAYWLKKMYGELPNDWHQAKDKVEKFRYAINAFTRMRFCHLDKTLELNSKQHPKHASKALKPWYQLNNALDQVHWVFGHWASLMGQCDHPNVYAIDTGCVWGSHLMLLRWHDKKIFTEPAHMAENCE